MKYRITMHSGQKYVFTSNSDLDTMRDVIMSDSTIKLTKNIVVRSIYIESIEQSK